MACVVAFLKLTVLMTFFHNVEREKIGGGIFLLIAKLNSRQFMTVSQCNTCMCTLAERLLLRRNLSKEDRSVLHTLGASLSSKNDIQ